MQALRALGRLLLYPTPALQDSLPAITEALEQEPRIPRSDRTKLKPLLQRLRSTPLMQNQELYVDQFDRCLSLHLFEYVYGQSRDRGKAMLELRALYESFGLFPETDELPDFLPLFCEALSFLPFQQSSELIAEAAHVLKALEERLTAENSDYAAVFAALASLSATKPHQADIEDILASLPRPLKQDADIDLRWREQPVRFTGYQKEEP